MLRFLSQRLFAILAPAAALIEMGGPAAGAQPLPTVDLATLAPADGVVRWIYGATGTGEFGVPVAGGRDVDGDALADYAVAYMTASPLGRFRAGEIDLVFGDGTTGGFVDTSIPDPSLLRFFGAGPSETAGSEIWIDDVTGDGLGDLLICRQNFSGIPGRVGSGALTIVPGGGGLRKLAAAFTAVDLAAPPGSLTITTVIGPASLDRLCIWARTGDVTGDGIADIAVGADQQDAPGEDNRGALYVIRGGAHLAVDRTIDLASFGSTALQGHIAKIDPPPGSGGFHFGATCQIADLDGNGRGEVLAAATLSRAGAGLDPPGAPGAAQSTGGAPDGILYIAWDDNFPEGPWPAGFAFDMSAPAGSRTEIVGEDANVNFGEEILGGLDYDNDGAADLFVGDLIGDGTADRMRPVSGVGFVFFTAVDLKGLDFDLDAPPPGLTLSRILGPGIGAIGADTAAHGDFDGDSVDDLAFASPHASPLNRLSAGVVHVLFGRPGGWPAEIDTAAGAFPDAAEIRIAEIQGASGTTSAIDVGDTLAYSAASGDVDGDGTTDLITNEMVGNGLGPGTFDVGNLIVVSGAALRGPSIFADGFETGDTGDWSGEILGFLVLAIP